MCGIIGYTGSLQAKDVLIRGLKRMEYRGYDSAGIAVQTPLGLNVKHKVGKVAGLEAMVESMDIDGTCGIGHTRWATHGKPSENNAHPHTACANDIAVVHNGIIENYATLKEELIGRGKHVFSSETDTEVIAHLVEEAYDGDLLEAVRQATYRLAGAYGIAVVCDAEPGVIVCARKDSPIVVGQGKSGALVASDIVALIDETRDVVVLEDDTFAKLTFTDGESTIEYFDQEGGEIHPSVTHVDWDVSAAEKGGFPDFMLKEIYEEPRTIRDTLAGRMVNGHLQFDELSLNYDELAAIDRVYIIACGTSYHAGLIAKNLIEGVGAHPLRSARSQASSAIATPSSRPPTLVVAVSQSGETADTLAAIRDARVKGAQRVRHHQRGRAAPWRARVRRRHLHEGQQGDRRGLHEVRSWAKWSALTLLAMLLAQVQAASLKMNQIRLLFRELADTAEQVERILAECEPGGRGGGAGVQGCPAARCSWAAAWARRSAAKAPSSSRRSATCTPSPTPAGEMKHGPIALIDEGFPVIAVATKSPVYDKLVSNLQEMQGARRHGGGHRHRGRRGDPASMPTHVIYIPKVRDRVQRPSRPACRCSCSHAPSPSVRGCDVDQPAQSGEKRDGGVG